MKRLFNLALTLSIAFSTFIGCNEEKKEERKPVSVLIYSDYMDPSMLKDFEATTGYPLQLELYEAQEEMIGKLQASGTAMYDVIIASDVVIQQMIHLNLLQKIDLTKIENRKNIDPKFLNPEFDPKNEYTVPYLWGTSGTLKAWPGSTMTYVKTNSNGYKIYSIKFSYEDYQNIIFTNGSSQTVDITLSGDNNVLYTINGESGGKFTCKTEKYS